MGCQSGEVQTLWHLELNVASKSHLFWRVILLLATAAPLQRLAARNQASEAREQAIHQGASEFALGYNVNQHESRGQRRVDSCRRKQRYFTLNLQLPHSAVLAANKP